MKKILILLILFGACFSLFGQDQQPPIDKFEYASIYLKIRYQGNIIIYDEKGNSKSPLLSLPNGETGILEDYSDPDNPKTFSELNKILNYMGSFGWSLKSSTMLPYEGDEGNTDGSNLLNFNEYAQFLIFERKVQ